MAVLIWMIKSQGPGWVLAKILYYRLEPEEREEDELLLLEDPLQSRLTRLQGRSIVFVRVSMSKGNITGNTK